MKKTCFALIGFVVLFGFTQIAFAANRSGAFIITPAMGYYSYAGKRHVDDQAMPNINLGYGFDDHWSAELFLGDVSTEESRANKRSINGGVYTLASMYHFRIYSKVQPYLLAGAGAINLHPHSNRDADVQANINAGAGLAYFFNDQIALRADVRDLYTIVGGKHDLLANFGVSILLFGDAPAQNPMPNLSRRVK
jgi:OmpA-OmpF porin, OOP family